MPAENLSTGWHGNLNLIYAKRAGTTQLIHNQNQAPLKVQRPFYPEGPTICHSIILHTAGGIVGGDHLSSDFHLQSNAHALITTAAAGKIYRSNGTTARQNIQIHLEADAYLEWLPQESIIFNGAIYRQHLKVELAPKATWLGWEITRFGRSARGEQFLQGNWRSHTEIWQQGQPLWIDRQQLTGGEEMFNSPHGLAGQPVVGTLAWVGQPATPEIVEKARFLWQTAEHQGEAGVSRLTAGLLCRYRGQSTSEVRNWFTDVWQLLRPSFLGRTSRLPRVWQT
jgi:urease accessory protein